MSKKGVVAFDWSAVVAVVVVIAVAGTMGGCSAGDKMATPLTREWCGMQSELCSPLPASSVGSRAVCGAGAPQVAASAAVAVGGAGECSGTGTGEVTDCWL